MVSSNRLTAVVVGAGWAGEGHTKALQHSGVDVLAICARTAAHVEQMAAKLHVPHASTNWRASLEQFQPDIVTIGTPANLRSEVVEAAVGLGCHIVGEKPLAATADEARQILALVDQAGVKHAYAATHRYDPGVIWMAHLIDQGEIGTLRHIDFTFCGPFTNPDAPWDINETISYGGGVMNLGLTHVLGMLERITRMTVYAAAGESRVLRTQAPVVESEYLHDTRQREKRKQVIKHTDGLERRPRDGDDAFAILFQMGSPSSEEKPLITVYLRVDMLAPQADPMNGWRFYGSEGTLIGEGLFELSLSKQFKSGNEAIPIPDEIVSALPNIGDAVENKWGALFRDFVADIRGESHEPYLTFHDGWRYQEIIDAVRHGKGWFHVPI